MKAEIDESEKQEEMHSNEKSEHSGEIDSDEYICDHLLYFDKMKSYT